MPRVVNPDLRTDTVFPLFRFFDFKIDLLGLLVRFGIILDRFVQYICYKPPDYGQEKPLQTVSPHR